MRLAFLSSFVGFLIALAADGSELIIYSIIGLFALGFSLWLFAAATYIFSGQWEIDRRLRSL